MSLPPPDETRALAERVKELRQGLEELEARIREMSVPAEQRALEPLDVPTVLTTNHAQRAVRRERAALVLGAAAAAGLVALGIGIGALLRAPATRAADAPAAATPPAASVTAVETAPPPAADPPAAPSATAALAPCPTTIAPAATVATVPATAAAATADDRTIRRKNDYGF